jgi:hypothetical protein
MYFEKYGFKTGNVILPGFNLEVNLPNNCYNKNDKKTPYFNKEMNCRF